MSSPGTLWKGWNLNNYMKVQDNNKRRAEEKVQEKVKQVADLNLFLNPAVALLVGPRRSSYSIHRHITFFSACWPSADLSLSLYTLTCTLYTLVDGGCISSDVFVVCHLPSCSFCDLWWLASNETNREHHHMLWSVSVFPGHEAWTLDLNLKQRRYFQTSYRVIAHHFRKRGCSLL